MRSFIRAAKSLAMGFLVVGLLAIPAVAQETGEIFETQIITPDGKVVDQAKAVARGAMSADQLVIDELQQILAGQAAVGNNPSNSAVLADVERLVAKYLAPPVATVKVTNWGPGQLRIVKADGSSRVLDARWQVPLNVGADRLDFIAENGQALIRLEVSENGPCRFWDEDDRRHFTLDAGIGIGGVPKTYDFTLAPGVRGYHLER